MLVLIASQEQKAEPEYGEDINPISRLIQIQQAKKEREPVYSLLEERGVPRRREFVMEVSI
jgi:double-stranded RNA-binding protein Staufen